MLLSVVEEQLQWRFCVGICLDLQNYFQYLQESWHTLCALGTCGSCPLFNRFFCAVIQTSKRVLCVHRYFYGWDNPDIQVNQHMCRDNSVYSTVQALTKGAFLHSSTWTDFTWFYQQVYNCQKVCSWEEEIKGEKSCKKPWTLMALAGSMCNSFNYESLNVLAHGCANTHGSRPLAEKCPAN